MSKEICAFCKTQPATKNCGCGFSPLLYCANRATCDSCEGAHRKIFGPFFKALLGSRPATRSNSPRTRLLGVLHELIVYRRSSIPRSTFVLNELRDVSAFSENDANFRAKILNVAGNLPLNQDFATSLAQKVSLASVVRQIEKLDDCVCASVRHGKEVKVVADFLDQIAPLFR
jgi:hypothetical protein